MLITEVLDMLIILISVIILQFTCISNYHIAHYKHIQLYLSFIAH